jgi:hypothetical protein
MQEHAENMKRQAGAMRASRDTSVADLGEAAKKVQANGAALKAKLDTIAKSLDNVQGPLS